MHLFIDSLLHASLQSTAYLCSDMDSFRQGMCLSCRQGHCNTLGYHIRQQPLSKKSKRLFLVTRAQAPFKGKCGWPRAFGRAATCLQFQEVPEVFSWSNSGSAILVFLKPQIPDSDADTASLFSQEWGHLTAKC